MTGMGAGARLRADLDGALAHASKESGQRLEFTEQERIVVARAAAAADRAEFLEGLWAAEVAGDRNVSVLTRLSAEIRLCEKQIVVLVARVNPGPGPVKSERHVRAARSRWDAKRLRDGA